MRRKFIQIALLVLFGFCLPRAVFAQQGPTITGITDNRSSYQGTQIPKYAKLEIIFQIDTSAQNFSYPYDAAPPAGITPSVGVSVNGLFTKDNWQTTYTQPAFYYQDFLWEQRNSRDWAYPTGSFSWKIRFAPPSAGTWKYKIEATDSSGTRTSGEASFTVSESANRGFVRVSQTDPRYFSFEDGTYFPGLGFAFNGNTTDIEANLPRLQSMGQNGIQLARIWLSSWSIWGSQWNPWYAMPNNYDGYLPRVGLEAFDGDFRLKLVYRASNPSDSSCRDNCSFWKATRFIGWMNPSPAVKPNTNYRIRVKYRAQNIAGPRNAASTNYGLIAKISNSWLDGSSASQPAAHNSGSGTVVTNYGGNVSAWSEISGSWNSGNSNFLPFFYLSLENIIDPGPSSSAGIAYIDAVYIEEDFGNGQYGPNILNKPKMNHLTYFDQKASLAFDKLLDEAESTGVYLRPVILEKQEYLQNHIDFGGVLRTDDPAGLFYGNGRNPTAVRWLQKAYWRYLQARWGYSTNIHSWELLNEGDPGLANHYTLTDELGKYMRQFAPDNHMVSTSNWHSFPASSWAAQPNIDFADVHAYISTGGFLYGADTALRDSMVTDAAKYHLEYSSAVRSMLSSTGRNMPIIRGEAGIDMYNVNGTNQNEQPDLARDTKGVWLHNYLWSGIDNGSLMESYWWTNNIHTQAGPDGQTGLYEIYGDFFNFLKNIPRNNGNYQALNVGVQAPYRAVGQIDSVNNRAHLWIQNTNHTWRKVVDGTASGGLPASVSVSGFTTSASLPVELTYFNSEGIKTIVNQNASPAGGNLSVNLSSNSAYTDVAVKIGNYDTSVTPTATPTSTAGDANGDGRVDGVDYVIWLTHYNQNVSGANNGDFNNSGNVDGADYVIWLTNYAI